MIEVYHFYPTRSVRVLWTLEELGLPYIAHPVGIPFKDNLPEGLGQDGILPIVIDDGNAMTESMAICELLCRRHGGDKLLVQPGSGDYQAYLEALWFGEASLGPYLRPMKFFGPQVPEANQNLGAYAWARGALVTRMAALERRLGDTGFVVGDDLTLADVSMGYALLIIESADESSLIGPRTAAYWSRVKGRPAYVRAHAPPA